MVTCFERGVGELVVDSLRTYGTMGGSRLHGVGPKSIDCMRFIGAEKGRKRGV